MPWWKDEVQITSGEEQKNEEVQVDRSCSIPDRGLSILPCTCVGDKTSAIRSPGFELMYHCSFPLQTHENREHLVMMEKVLGPIPSHMIHRTR